MTQKKVYFLLFIFFLLGHGDSFAQKKEKESIQWLSFAQLKDSMASNPKKIFVDIYTDWCGPCKLMDKKVFPKSDVVRLMNQNYYAIKLNSESADSLNFNGKDYFLKPYKTTIINELVVEIGLDAGHLSYPTIVILNENFEVTYRYPGMLTLDLMIDVLETWK
jgi:thioredoxin-related protein